MEAYNALVLSLPTRNSTLRMRLWRALKETGCGILRDGVYALPHGAEFTHVKNRVTFEVLLAAFGLEHDAALAKIGAAVHFLDVGGIPAPDAKAVETMLKGAKEKARGDDALLAEAMRVLDLLYSGYATSSRS